jgi:hypothetical protein
MRAAVVAVVVAVSALSGSAAAAEPGVTGMKLTHYPFTPKLQAEHGVIPDQTLLDAFAREYGNHPRKTIHGRMTTTVRNPEEFFNFWLPNRLYNIAMGTQGPPAGTDLDLSTDAGLGRALWLAHLNGYYGGVWLRNDWSRFDEPRSGGTEPSDDQLSATYARVVDEPRRMANHGTDEEVVEYSRFALRGRLPTPSTDVVSTVVPANDEVGMFGFDASYLRYLLPPYPNKAPATKPPVDPYFTLDETQLLTATYGIPEEPFLVQARKNFARIDDTGGDATMRRTLAEVGNPGEEPLLAHQNRLGTLATGLYLPPGDYTGFDQAEYDQLLSWTIAGVMINHANGLNALAAYSLKDPALSRRQIRSSAMWWAFTYLYVMGVMDPHHDGKTLAEAQPKFTFATKKSCASRRRFTVRLPRQLRRATVTVAGRRVMTRRRGRRLRATVDLRGMTRAMVHVVIDGRTRSGSRIRQTRRYRVCAGRSPRLG